MKFCKACKQTKDLADFAPKGFYCRACCNIKQRAWQKNHRGYRGTGKVKRFEDRRLMARLRRLRQYANSRSTCTLSDDFLLNLWRKQDGKCALSGMQMSIEINDLFVVSLDQVFPGQGYSEDNVQLLAWCVNRAKGDLPLGQFLFVCQQITRRCNDYPVREYSQVAGSAQPS